VLLYHSISYWTVSFLQRYGFNPKALLAFASIDGNVVGGSQYERIKSLRLLSMSLRMKSKVPKILGARFHAMVSEKYRPVINELWSLCKELVAVHDSDEWREMATPLSSAALRCFSVGCSPLSNPFPSIYEAILEFLPLAVDRIRKDVRETRKGYPASWPDSTPPASSQRKKKMGDVPHAASWPGGGYVIVRR
jgi:hypothetical protein